MKTSRIIKFRAYNKTCGHFLKDDDFDIKPDGSIWIHSRTASGGWGGSHKQNIEGRNEIILQQFTGLQDSKGKEIYEGDIVKQLGEYNQPYNQIVEFSGGRFCPLVKVEYGYNAIDDYDANLFEVIGNIFENPELLSVTK